MNSVRRKYEAHAYIEIVYIYIYINILLSEKKSLPSKIKAVESYLFDGKFRKANIVNYLDLFQNGI